VATRTERRRVLRISLPGSSGHRADLLAVEEPLEIRIGGTPLTVTMPTPGDDIDLAAGFLFGEGLLQPAVDLRQIRMCDENVADVTLGPAALPLARDVVGWALREGRLPLAGQILLVSGRASFELVQKACMAGIPVLAAVSAPSSLAVGLAEEAGLTLVGFLRGTSMNAYTGTHRLTAVPAPA